MSVTNEIENTIRAQLGSPPSISIQILGTHLSAEQTEVDFDIWIDFSTGAKIESGEFRTGNESDHHSWSQSETPDESLLSIASDWVEEWLNSEVGDRESWSVFKSISLHEEELYTLKAHIERLARRTAYGGSTRVEVHTQTFEANIPKNTAVVHTKWIPINPFLLTENPWDTRVMNAMVDRKKGFLSLDDPPPSNGRSPLRRAMKRNNTSTIVYEDLREDGSKYIVSKFSKWGADN